MSFDVSFHSNDIKGTSEQMTPVDQGSNLFFSNSHSDDDDDDDDDVFNTDIANENISSTKTHRLSGNRSSQYLHHQTNQRVERDELTTLDVVLGRSNYEDGPYLKTLREYWDRYESVKHSKKRDICREAIDVMHQRGVRFLNRVEDGTRDGYYTIEPKGSDRIERKVLRGLRQEVLNSTVRKSDDLVKVNTDIVIPDAAITTVHPVIKAEAPKSTPIRRSKAKKADRTPRKKNSESHSQMISSPKKVTVRKKPKIKAKKVAVLPATSKYVPILPLPAPTQLEALPPLPPITIPPFPTMTINTSLGSVMSGNRDDSHDGPLIPSAINFGTSDLLAPVSKLLKTKKPPSKSGKVVGVPNAASPDTVIPSNLFPYFSNQKDKSAIAGKGTSSFKDFQDIATSSVGKIPLRSHVSYDFSRIFDDTIDDVDDQKVSPPFFTDRQSSMFSAINFTEWNNGTSLEDSNIDESNRSGTTNPNERMSSFHPAIPKKQPRFQHTKNVSDNKAVDDDDIRNVTRKYSFDQNTIFDEGLIPLSPSPMRCTTSNGSDYTTNTFGTGGGMTRNMRYITPKQETPGNAKVQAQLSTLFDEANINEYQALCAKLDDSIAKLEKEELEHKSWEAHNEALWRHFIKEQPDLAKMLMSRAARDTAMTAASTNHVSVSTDVSSSFNHHHVTPSTTLAPRVPTTESVFDDGIRVTSPVPWWFHDTSKNPTNEGFDSDHHQQQQYQSVTMKWQHLFASDNEDNWEEV